MLRRKRFYVIYPEYFDKKLSRSQGRKVSLDIAAEEPSLKKLIFACKKLKIDYEEEEDKSYPTRWWEQNGRLLIPIDRKNKVPKSEIIDQMADIVRRIVHKKKIKKKKQQDKDGKYAGRTPPVR